MIRIIAKNIIRRPFRNGALIISFAFIAASLFAGHYLIDGATDNVKSAISRLGADIIVVPGQDFTQSTDVILRGDPSTFFFDNATTTVIANVDGVGQVAPQLYLATLGADCCSQSVELIAIDPNRDFTITPWLKERQNEPLGKDEIIVGSNILGSVGSNLTFYGHPFTIIGRLEPTGTGVDVSVFLRMEDAYSMATESANTAVEPLVIPEGRVSAVLVRVNDTRTADTVALNIQNHVPGTRVITSTHLVNRVSDQLSSVTRVLDLAALFATLVTLPLIALVSVMATNERRREIGVLRALGATRKKIFQMIIGESLVLAAIGGLLGTGVSCIIIFILQRWLSTLTQVTIIMPHPVSLMSGALSAILITAAIGGLASLYPAYLSATLDPYEAMRTGEP
ncbi:MAG: FtsX-like permease family protein [Methanoregula sp.]|nr:FtsX-like permease family protein [Methanoregula sp.]